jgi:hypothetical protein
MKTRKIFILRCLNGPIFTLENQHVHQVYMLLFTTVFRDIWRRDRNIGLLPSGNTEESGNSPKFKDSNPRPCTTPRSTGPPKVNSNPRPCTHHHWPPKVKDSNPRPCTTPPLTQKRDSTTRPCTTQPLTPKI